MPTLKTISNELPGLEWVPVAYADSSRATHMFTGVDNIVSVDADGIPQLTWVAPRTRVVWLIWTMVAFGNAIMIAEKLVAGPDAGGLGKARFSELLEALLNDPFLESVGRA